MIDLPTDENPVVIIHGDCLDILPQIPAGVVDAVVTDPPYGLGDKWQGGGGGAKSSWKFNPKEAQSWDKSTVPSAIDAILKIDRPTVIWGGNYYQLPPSRCWFLWDKGQPDTWTTAQAEMAWTNIDRPVRIYRMCQAVAHDEMRPKYHPTQKPTSLVQWCIRMMRLHSNSVILDPFAGSGTTGVAAILEGRKAILIEKDAGYIEVIKKRIAETLGRPTTLANGKTVGRNLFESVGQETPCVKE